MQTFLPYPDFSLSAKSLDRARLGKQRLEAYQILESLLMSKKLKPSEFAKLEPWQKARRNHWVTQMWDGYEEALAHYTWHVIKEWRDRGYADTMRDKLYELMREYEIPWRSYNLARKPKWLGQADLHISHQSMLIQKDPNFYKPKFPDTPEGLEYVRPVTRKQKRTSRRHSRKIKADPVEVHRYGSVHNFINAKLARKWLREQGDTVKNYIKVGRIWRLRGINE